MLTALCNRLRNAFPNHFNKLETRNKFYWNFFFALFNLRLYLLKPIHYSYYFSNSKPIQVPIFWCKRCMFNKHKSFYFYYNLFFPCSPVWIRLTFDLISSRRCSYFLWYSNKLYLRISGLLCPRYFINKTYLNLAPCALITINKTNYCSKDGTTANNITMNLRPLLSDFSILCAD